MADLLLAIECAKRKTPSGPDAISYEAFNNLSNDVLAQIVDSINEVWLSGDVPGSSKVAHIVRILKSCKPAMVLENLRPVSLTAMVGKLLEKMLTTRLLWWLEKHGYYHPAQIGFRPSLGSEDGLSVSAASTLSGSRSHGVRTILAMDIQKAYDNISHAAILESTDIVTLETVQR